VILQRSGSDAAGAQHPLKIGVFGLVPPQILAWDRLKLEGRLTLRTSRRLRAGGCPSCAPRAPTPGVTISRSGFERGETPRFAENSVAGLAEVRGIDAILCGQSHGEFPGQFFATLRARSAWRAARSTACPR
jgi:2',3'-cyclic-nucleotide 2'-phosphodiesterase/3'-nucleotidase